MQRYDARRASRCLDSMILDALEKIVADKDLTRPEAEGAMEDILAGRASDALIAGLLTALRIKGETVDEVVGFAKAMRRHATPIFPDGRVRHTNRWSIQPEQAETQPARSIFPPLLHL